MVRMFCFFSIEPFSTWSVSAMKYQNIQQRKQGAKRSFLLQAHSIDDRKLQEKKKSTVHGKHVIAFFYEDLADVIGECSSGQ